MLGAVENKKKKAALHGLVKLAFSWSITDLMNDDLYKNRVEMIPHSFSSTGHYFNSFINPLIEETRADLRSNIASIHCAPTREIVDVDEHRDFKLPENLLYNIHVERDRSRSKEKSLYEPEVGDLIAFTDVKPKCVDDLDRPKRRYTVAIVKQVEDEESARAKDADGLMKFQVQSSSAIMFGNGEGEKGQDRDKLFVVHLTNLTTNIRIWNALHLGGTGVDMKMINSLLRVNPNDEENCRLCFNVERMSSHLARLREVIGIFGMDDSQEAAILNCIVTKECHHRNDLKLIWGPPGTGKTKTIASLLFALQKMKCRTVTCAPTNVAVIGVTKKLRSLLSDMLLRDKYGLGDIVLFGNGKRMKISDHKDLHDVFLDDRAKVLARCFAPKTGWNGTIVPLISLLEDPLGQYLQYLKEEEEKQKQKEEEEQKQKQKQKQKEDDDASDDNGDNTVRKTENSCVEETEIGGEDMEEESFRQKLVTKILDGLRGKCKNLWTLDEFIKNRFDELSSQLMDCSKGLYTHMPTSCLKLEVAINMFKSVDMLRNLRTLINTVLYEKRDLRQALRGRNFSDCLEVLRFLCDNLSVPKHTDKFFISNFCLQWACLIFSTCSSTAKLQHEGMKPFELLIIDEAAQLKECESAIPLQVPGIRHAILVGDEKQLPAMVQSKLCERANFGRSLFERLVMLGHPTNLLAIQYRMHPSISLFPNKEFYDKKITDGPNVREEAYTRTFLEGDIFGSYSFIDVINGKEEFDDSHSLKNMVEVSVVAEIVSKLHKACLASKRKLRVGCLSPYKAQVYAMQQKLEKMYSTDVDGDFSVNVRSVDGFQGGEEDVIIFSTVRCNHRGSVGFLSDRRRVNVALTRARHCLWILGNSTTLLNSASIWKKLVLDSQSRGCLHNAFDDKDMAQAINSALVEFGQFSSLFNSHSLAFKNAKWKVSFCDEFNRSMSRTKDVRVCNEVLSLLEKLANGWRQPVKNDLLSEHDGVSSELLEIYDVKYSLKLIWTIDIDQENAKDVQVIKILDILPDFRILALAKKLDFDFDNFTVKHMRRCLHKHVEGDTILPMSWPTSSCQVSNRKDKLVTQLAAVSLRDKPETSRRSYRGRGRVRTRG